MYGFIVLLHAVGFVVLFAFIAPNNYHLGGDHPVFTVGVGILAYTLGLRHAFDADHIAAVDNTTRKLIADNLDNGMDRKPLSVGFWFSLGHSTIVFALSLLLALGVKALVGPVEDERSTLHTVTALIGPSVSGIFLWILGILNLVALVGIIKVFRDIRRGHYDEATALEKAPRLPRLHEPIPRRVDQIRDQALAHLSDRRALRARVRHRHRSRPARPRGGGAAFNLPFYAVLVLPILFAAGMCLMDTTDGVFMNYAYGWAFAKPVRKVFYNLTITSISVAVALVIGTIELVGVIAERLGIDAGPWPGLPTSTSTSSATASSPCSWSPGSPRWPCGVSATSKNAGRQNSPSSPSQDPHSGDKIHGG